MATLSDALASRAHDAALEQRARLLEAVWARPEECRALLPEALLPCGPPAPLDGYGADLAPAPDGTWRVVRDRVSDHPGAILLQAPLLSVFLPALCRRLLGQPLQLQSWPILWWRDAATRARVAAHAARFRLRDGFDPDDAGTGLAALTPAERVVAQHRADAWPDRFVVTLEAPATVRHDCKRILTVR